LCAVKHWSATAGDRTRAEAEEEKAGPATVAPGEVGQGAVQRLLEEVEVADDREARRALDAAATMGFPFIRDESKCRSSHEERRAAAKSKVCAISMAVS
jgi:hypothetical protein